MERLKEIGEIKVILYYASRTVQTSNLPVSPSTNFEPALPSTVPEKYLKGKAISHMAV